VGSKGSNTTTSSFKPPAEFMKAYKEALGMARQATSQPYQQYGGQLVAGLTPSQQQSIANINAAQGMALPAIQSGMGMTNEAAQYAREGADYGRRGAGYIQQGGNYINQGAGYLGQGAGYVQQGGALTQEAAERNRLAAQGITPELYQRFYSPYVRDVANSTFANLMESQAQQQSGLKSGAIQAGAFGGDRSGVAQAEMARQQQLANAMSMSNIYNQGYGQAMGLAGQQVANLGETAGQLAGMGQQYGNLGGQYVNIGNQYGNLGAQSGALGTQYSGLGSQIGSMGQQIGSMGQQYAGLGAGAQASVLQGAQAQMAAGAQEQATEQARLQAAYEQWMQRQSYPYQQAQFFANIAQGLGAGAGGTSSTTAPAPNMFSQILGGIGAIGSIYGASDKRVKENIEAVGKLNDGQTIYRYNFKGDPKTQIGLLAQEVEHHKPGAVAEVKGLKMVNYKDATDDAASMGGVVGPSEFRQGLAGGGEIPYHPYGDARSYVPEGKAGGRSASIPDAPKPFADEGLAKDWQTIMPLSKEQAGGLRKLASDVGIDLPEKGDISALFKKKSVGPTEVEKAWISLSEPGYDIDGYGMSSGGLVGRRHYAAGGVMDQAIDEAAGLGAAPEFEAPEGLIRSESGGDFGAKNAQGYVGRAQFGPERLVDVKRAGVIPAEMTSEQFRVDPEAQKAAENWHFKDINNFIDATGLASVEGKSIKGIPVTREGLVNVAHLGGKGGLEKFVASGGRYDPADDNGTRLSDYLALGAKSGGLGDAVVVPASAEGLAGADEAPAPEGTGLMSRLKIDPSKIFASEDNPSLIEKIMGRRLSPEARSAVMNASFALMAGRSPFFFTNLGEAGKVGTQTYYNALGQGAEIAKQQAEIGLSAQERETQRMNAETARLNAARQLYAQMLPQIRFWQMRNPGKPLPDEYRRVVDAAYPPSSTSSIVRAPGMEPETAAQPDLAPVIQPNGGSPSPAPENGSMPPATGAEGVGETVPAPTAGSTGNSQLDAMYAQLPNELNPNYWTQMAEAATTTEDYNAASERAAKLTEQFQQNGIPLPGGVVTFPGKPEMQTEADIRKFKTESALKATSEQTERADSVIRNYPTAKNTLDQAADTLKTTTTGQLENTKAYLVTALNSLGLGADADRLDQATGVQELNKIFSKILFDGGLKDKIGSQIAATELQMFSRGFGDVSLEPAANRFIVGTMRGILEMDRKRAQDWIEQVGDKPMPRREIAAWEAAWAEKNPISDFVRNAIANTPVKGEINWSDPSSRARVKEGYKYIVPKGSYPFGSFSRDTVVTYTGNGFDVEE